MAVDEADRMTGHAIYRSLLSLLFHDRAAGDTIARISGGVGLQVVRFRVDHQRGAAVRENRMITVSHIDPGIDHRNLSRTVRLDSEVGHVAGVGTFRVLQAMVFHVRIEMRAGGGESGAFALSNLMNVY